jgi:hypothetical protein
MSSHRLDTMLRAISTCEFNRGCVMLQFGGRSTTSGRGSGFCITITHRAIHRLLCSNSSPRKHSCHYPTTVLSGPRSEWLWLFHILKWASRGHVSKPWRTSNRIWRPNCGRLKKNLSRRASNNGRIDETNVCALARALLWRWLGKRCFMSNHYSAIPQFREFFDIPSYINNEIYIYLFIISSPLHICLRTHEPFFTLHINTTGKEDMRGGERWQDTPNVDKILTNCKMVR